MKTMFGLRCRLLLPLMLPFMAVLASAAATATWVGNTSANWSQSPNWTYSSGSGPVANGDSLVFNAAGSSGTTLNNDIAGLTVRNLTIKGPGAFTFGGNGLVLNGTLTDAASVNQTFSGGITIGTGVGAAIHNMGGGGTLALGTLSHTAASGGTVKLTTTGPTSTSTLDQNGMIGGWAVIVGSSSYSWAHSGSNGVNSITTAATATTTPVTATQNWLTSGGVTLSANATVNSITKSGGDLQLGSGVALTVGSGTSGGGILLNGGAYWIKPSAGGDTSPSIMSGLTSGELFFYVMGNDNHRILVSIEDNNSTPCTLVKDGPQAMYLCAFNTYSGNTYLNAGTLYLERNGQLSSEYGSMTNSKVIQVASGAALDVSALSAVGGFAVAPGQTLLGGGAVNGAVAVGSGGTLAGGTPSAIGTLLFDSALTFSAGSTNLMRISKTGGTPANDALRGITNLIYGGTLIVSNITTDASTFTVGDTFKLFDSSSYSGSFSELHLPSLTGTLAWDTSRLTVDGTINVRDVNITPNPSFSPPAGSYFGAQSVMISSEAGSTIFYTTDGSDPATSGTVISGASPITGIVIPANTTLTLKAYASHSGTANSPVVSATYATTSLSANVGIWTAADGGVYSVSRNWAGGLVPKGSGWTADFSALTLSGNTTVTLDAALTIGNMLFGDKGNIFDWTVGGTPKLTLSQSNGTPTLAVSNLTTTISPVMDGTNGLTKTGNGNLKLTAINTFVGGTTVDGGTLTLANGGEAGCIVDTLTIKPGAAVLCTARNALGYAANTGRKVNGVIQQVLTANVTGGRLETTYAVGTDGDCNFSTVFNLMGGELRSNGGVSSSTNSYWVLDHANGFLDGVNTLATNIPSVISGGLKLRNITGTGPDHTFDIAAGTATPDLLVSAAIFGGGCGIIKTGPGVMWLTGDNTQTGTNTVQAGVLCGVGTILGPTVVASGGTLQAGTTNMGTLAISNTLTLNDGGTTRLRISKTGGVPTNDRFTGITTLTMGGTLIVTNITAGGNTLAEGDTFTLFSAASYSGAFSAYTLPALTGTLAWQTARLNADGSIMVINTNNHFKPRIVKQPVSDRVLTNTPAAFSVSAYGYPAQLDYQWYAVVGGVTNLLADGTNSTYTTPPVQDSDTGNGYFAVVHNTAGSVASDVAILTARHLILVPVAGILQNDQFFGLANLGTALGTQLYPGSTYPDSNPPDKVQYLTSFTSKADLPSGGERISGWFIPSVSGDYIFFEASAAASTLWLSTDDTAAHAYQIAQNQAAMTARDWTLSDTSSAEYTYGSGGEYRSDRFELGGGQNAFANFNKGWAPYPNLNPLNGGIPLVAGRRYYIELDHFRGGGVQHAAVTYKLAGNADPAVGSASLLTGANISSMMSVLDGAKVTITNQPTDATVQLGQTGSFSVGAMSYVEGAPAAPPPSIVYQWYAVSGGVTNAIAGATSANYVTAPTVLADDGKQFYCILTTLGYQTNTVTARLNVSSGPPPQPRIVSIALSGGNVVIRGTNGPSNGTYQVLTSTNVALPRLQWTPTLTNSFDANGNFAATNSQPVGSLRQFYLLQLP